MTTQILDVVGRPIKVGHRVAFAALSYRRAGLRVGQVVETATNRRDSVRVYEPSRALRREHRASLRGSVRGTKSPHKVTH